MYAEPLGRSFFPISTITVSTSELRARTSYGQSSFKPSGLVMRIPKTSPSGMKTQEHQSLKAPPPGKRAA